MGAVDPPEPVVAKALMAAPRAEHAGSSEPADVVQGSTGVHEAPGVQIAQGFTPRSSQLNIVVCFKRGPRRRGSRAASQRIRIQPGSVW